MGGLCALSVQCNNRGLMHLQVVSSNCISVYAITKLLYANPGPRKNNDMKWGKRQMQSWTERYEKRLLINGGIEPSREGNIWLCLGFIGFNPDTSSIQLHGNVIGISAVEFGRVMGLKNTGEVVELEWLVEDEKAKELVKSFGGNGKRVLVRALAEQLEKCENADEDFKVRFVMFALGTVLCPTSSPSVTGNYLTFLTIPGKIETKNWADHGFNFLCEVYVDKSLDPIVSWDNKSVWKMIKWVRKQGGFDSPTVRVVSKHSPTNEVSRVNLERIVQEVAVSLAPIIQAEVKRSVEGLAITLGPIIQAEVQRSMLELTDKVMSQVSSFNKDARQHLHPGHEDVNQTKDSPLKERDQGGESVVKKKGEEASKLKEKGVVDVNNTWMPLPDGQSFSEPELKIGMEKRKFTKPARGDETRIKTRRTAERRPGVLCREPWVDPSTAKGKVVHSTTSNNLSSDEIIIQIENKHHVTRGEFMCLRPEEWINDGVLNAHVYYLEEKGSGNWYFPTYMAEQVLNTSDGQIFELAVKLRRENTNRFTVGLKKCEKMFIPVFDRIGSHWYLIVVLPSDKKVEIWDSLPGPKYNAGRYQQAERIVWACEYLKAHSVLHDVLAFVDGLAWFCY
ncbi:UB-like protease 1A, partial [Prunus dulcis]